MRALLVRASFLVVSLAVATGCSSSSSDDRGPQAATDAPGWTTSTNASGSRLRAKVILGGGAREVIGFFDSLRKEECTFQRTGAGWRCIPAATFQQNGNLYSDASCTNQLQVVQTCQADPKYVMNVGGVGCGNVVTSYRVVTGPAPNAFAVTTTGCAPSSAVTTALKGFVVGPEVPLTDFVEAVETPTTNGALTETVLVASDGARQHLSYSIASLGAECTFQVMADGITRCVPKTQSAQILYLDSACTTAAYAFASSGSGACGIAADLVRENAPFGGCGALRNVFKVGEQPSPSSSSSGEPDPSSPGPTLYSSAGGSGATGGSCIGSSYYNARYARPVTSVTSSLPATPRVGRGDGRLVPTLVSKAGSEELTAGWHDNERNVDCTFETASDGKLRCMPTGANGLVFYADTSCKSEGRVAVRGGPLSCAQAASKYVRVTPQVANPNNPPTNCAPPTNPLTRVYELGAEVKNFGASSFESTPGRCAQVAGVNGGSDAKEIDPALFVEGVTSTE